MNISYTHVSKLNSSKFWWLGDYFPVGKAYFQGRHAMFNDVRHFDENIMHEPSQMLHVWNNISVNMGEYSSPHGTYGLVLKTR